MSAEAYNAEASAHRAVAAELVTECTRDMAAGESADMPIAVAQVHAILAVDARLAALLALLAPLAALAPGGGQ